MRDDSAMNGPVEAKKIEQIIVKIMKEYHGEIERRLVKFLEQGMKLERITLEKSELILKQSNEGLSKLRSWFEVSLKQLLQNNTQSFQEMKVQQQSGALEIKQAINVKCFS
jgi:hypothetical protein